MQNRVFHFLSKTLFLLLCTPFFSIAQTSVKSLDKTYDWEKTDKTETVYVEVDKASEKLVISFEGKITEGDFELTVYDPQGDRVAGFTLISSGEEHSDVHTGSSDGRGKNTTVTIESTDPDADVDLSSGHSKTSTTTVTTESGKNKVKVKKKSKNSEGKAFTVTTTKSDSKGAKGIMKKVILDPAPGKWKFVMEIKKVSGSMAAQVEQN